ncbi:MAG: hypothetical protein WCS94_13830 [Verrucomicrobiota bacterium]
MKQLCLISLLAVLVGEISAFALPGQFDAAYTNLNLQVALNSLLALPDGRAVVGFNNASPIFNGTNVGAVLQLNTDGTLDGSFAAGDTNKYTIYSVARLTGGNLLVAGSFTNWAGAGRKTLVKLDATGAVQTGFLSGVTSTLKIYTGEQPDGKIILASSGTSLTATNGTTLPPVARLLADGTRDTNFFTTNLINSCYALDLVPDGSGRYFLAYLNSSNAKYVVARFNADGTFDTNFAPATLDNILTLVHALPNGGVMVSGYFTTYTNSFGLATAAHLVRINPDGSRDTSFNFTDGRISSTFVVQADGKVILPGASLLGKDRFKQDGSLDPSWTNNGTVLSTTVMTIDSLDRVLTGGYFVNAVYRLQNDASFGPIPPIFYSSLTNASVYPGDSTNFTLTAGGPGLITYQWQFNSNNIPNATNAILDLVNCQLTNAGFYRLVASNTNGATASTNGLLTVRLDPRITQSPAPAAADGSDTVSFSVGYTSLSPVTFQWFLNGNPVFGATNNPFVIAPVASTNAGNYSVRVGNSYGTNTSAAAALTVNGTLRIKQQPATNILMFAGSVTNLTGVAAGDPPLNYQWFLNGAPLAGATTGSLVFNPAVRTNSGTYQLVVTNNSGAVTSSVAALAIFGNGQNAWLTTNAEPGFGAASSALTCLAVDGLLGVAVGGVSGVARYDDDGTLRWLMPFLPATNSTSPTIYVPPAVAVDGRGNTFVAASFVRTLSIGGLSVTNPGTITVNNPNGRATLLAKLDSNGNAVWIRNIDGGFDNVRIAVDGSGAVIISGSHTGVINFGPQSAAANSFGSSAVARYAADGTFIWKRDYFYYTTTGAVEADAVVADGTNIWVGGIFHGSMKFGVYTTANASSGYTYWFGRMDTNGSELWLQTGPNGAQGVQLSAGLDQSLTAANTGSTDSLLARYSTNGTALFYKTGDSVTARVSSVTVDSNNVAVVNGMFYTTSFIGTNNFNQPGSQTNNFYTARYGTNGIGVGVVVNGTSSSAVTYGFKVAAYFSAGNRRGDVYVAGYPSVTVGATNLTGTNVFLAKLSAPGLAPYVLVQPNASYTSTSLSTFQLTTAAGGQAPLTYQWRNNGVPLPAATNATLAFAAPLPTDNGSYDCVIANDYGTTATVASQVTFTPPFSIYRQPNSVGLVFGTNTVSGSDIVAGFLGPNAMIGRTFNCFITNGSGMWPATANFPFNLSSASAYNIPSGTLGTHSGSWGLQVALPTQTILSLYYWSTSPSNIPSSIAFHTGGGFDIHHDITDPAGCCANGYFTIGASANSNAIFSAATTGSVIPTIQWYRNGILLVGQTNTTLSYVPAGYAQVGTYTASFTYSNYVVTTAPSTLVIYPPAIGYTFVPGSSSMDFSIPPGYVLQSTTTLSPPNWTTISTNSTYTVPLNLPGAFFRIAP